MIHRLVLSAYRNHMHLELNTASHKTIVLHGDNGAGKTNILEAISLFGGSTGLRKGKWAHFPYTPSLSMPTSVYAERADGISTALQIDEDGTKHIYINGAPCRRVDWADVWSFMWLTPEQDRLFLASPETRRQVLDRWVYAFFPEHATQVRHYEKLLKERQAILQQEGYDPSWLDTTEHLLAEKAYVIHSKRVYVLQRISEHQEKLPPDFPRLDVALNHNYESAEELQNFYKLMRKVDAERGSTQHGPHRSDLQVTYQGIQAALRSTGEQKMIVLTLFLSALSARSHAIHMHDVKPSFIVLLDDIVSHLDAHHRSVLLGYIEHMPMQTWVSGTDKSTFDGLLSNPQFIHCGVKL